MGIKVGINGFGRIGRVVSRACLQNCDLQLSAINDPAISVEYVSYLLKFDSTHGKFNGIITHTDNEIIINGHHHIKVFHEKLPLSVPWHSAGVQYVVEASGMYTNHDKAAGHLSSDGVKRVIVTAPSVDIPMIVLGVNDCTLSRECKVISCASSTLYCLAPIIKVLEDSFGVEEGFITSIHAMTPSLKPLDGLCLRGRHWRDHRSIHQNIIPASTGACKALGKILPQVKDKLSGLAFRVPIVNVSVLDLTIRLKTNTTVKEIAKSVQQASKTTLCNIIKVSSEESVSSDFIGETRSCIFDENSSIQLKPNFLKCVCWYENEYSYACRVIDTIIYSENQIYLEIPKEMTNVRQFLRKHNVLQQTESSQGEMSTVCKSKPGVNSDVVSSVSQDTGVKIRSSPALVNRKQFFAKKPACKVGTKTEELLKLLKNNDFSEKPKPSTIANRCSFFQSCLGFSQAQKKIKCDTQARLENVKKEFTKMVSVTENLLKKPYNSQSNVQSTFVDEVKSLNGFDLKSKDDVYEEGAESCKKCENNNLVDECGDCKSSIDLSNVSQPQNEHCNNKDDSESLVSYEKEKSEYSDCNSNITKNSKNFVDMTESGRELNRNNRNNDKEDLIKINNEKFVTPDKNSEFTQITKTFATLIDGLSQNRKVRCVWDDHNIETITAIKKENISSETRKNANRKNPKPICASLSLEKKASDILETNHIESRADKTAFKMDKFVSPTEKCNIKIIGEVLRKRNIILVDSPFVAKSQSELCNQENDGSTAEIVENMKDTRLSEQIIEELTCKVKSVLIVSEETAKSTPEHTTKTISSVDCECMQDIYDKLDSASESNSNNSFGVNEKKSQVIQITDITNSLEDLSRLDKICRIIEISDELSDKLFSALDDNNMPELKKQRWSFKDLCKRIKLDEFCNKVFSGNAV